MTPIKANAQSSQENSDGDQKTGSISRKERNVQRNTTFRVRDDLNFSDKSQSEDAQVISSRSTSPSQALEQEEDNVANSGKEALVGDENTRAKGQLIEVDLSELKDGSADGTAEGEQKNALGFFFKVKVRIVVLLVCVMTGKKLLIQRLSLVFILQDDEKAEDEMAKRRAAFLLKQQRKAEETRLRKQQQEADVELKRDEARYIFITRSYKLIVRICYSRMKKS